MEQYLIGQRFGFETRDRLVQGEYAVLESDEDRIHRIVGHWPFHDIEIVEEIGQRLGKHIAGLINIFNPEMVIIGGTLALTEDYILQPIKTAVRKYSLNMVNKDSVIVTSKLKEKAGVVGACMLARSRTFEY